MLVIGVVSADFRSAGGTEQGSCIMVSVFRLKTVEYMEISLRMVFCLLFIAALQA
jgi:hypothetical protein